MLRTEILNIYHKKISNAMGDALWDTVQTKVFLFGIDYNLLE